MLNDRVQKLKTHRASSVGGGLPIRREVVAPYVAPLLIGASLPFLAKMLDPLMNNPALWETFFK